MAKLGLRIENQIDLIIIIINSPDDIIGEHFLSLPFPERIQIAARAVINGVTNKLIGIQNAAESRQKRVPETPEDSLLEANSPVLVAVGHGGGGGRGLRLLLDQCLGDYFQSKKLVAVFVFD